MALEQLIRQKSADIKATAAKHGAEDIRLFGSVVRGEAGPDSDVDFLVDTGPSRSSWFPGGLVLDLEEILRCRVEIVTERGLNPYIREHLLCEAVPL